MGFNRLIYNRFFAFSAAFFLTVSGLNAQSLEEKEAVAEGNAFYLQKEFDKARASYSKVLAMNPSSVKANYNLGNTFYELKSFDQAASHYTQAAQRAETKEDKAKAYHNLGNAQMQQKKYKEAIESYKSSLRNNPKDNQTRYNFALAKKLLDSQENKPSPPKLPEPSVYAREQKGRADLKAQEGNFGEALGIMENALKRDSTVRHFHTYIEKLNEVVILDTIGIK